MATHLLSGNDESILRSAVHELVDELVGAGDRAMMVDEFDGDEYELRLVVDAAQTPSFLTDKRVVVARDVGRFMPPTSPRCSHTSPIRSSRPTSSSWSTAVPCRRSSAMR